MWIWIFVAILAAVAGILLAIFSEGKPWESKLDRFMEFCFAFCAGYLVVENMVVFLITGQIMYMSLAFIAAVFFIMVVTLTSQWEVTCGK
jgi:hypothetical protein